MIDPIDLNKLNRRESKASVMRRLRRDVRPRKHKVSVADALEFRREAYCLTRAEFCELLGMRQNHYSEVVNGRISLPIKATRRAFALGVPAVVLLQINEE